MTPPNVIIWVLEHFKLKTSKDCKTALRIARSTMVNKVTIITVTSCQFSIVKSSGGRTNRWTDGLKDQPSRSGIELLRAAKIWGWSKF